MEYQKLTNLLENASDQTSKFRTKNWVKINVKYKGGYNVNRQIKFKPRILKSSLCNYTDAYILIKGTITIADLSAAGAAANNTNKKIIFKNCTSFTNCISEINNTQINNAKHIYIVMPIYNLWKYCKDILAVKNNSNLDNFNEANATDSFNSRSKLTGQTDDDGEIDNMKIMVPLKY